MDLQSCPTARGPRAASRPRVIRWAQIGFLALMAASLATGVALAATDPDWFGSDPVDVSHSPLERAWQPAVGAAAEPPTFVAVQGDR